MRIEAIEISQHEGDTLYFRTEHPETGEDRVARLCEAIENGTEFTAEDLLGLTDSGDIVVDLDARLVTVAGADVALTPKEFELLAHLGQRVGAGHLHGIGLAAGGEQLLALGGADGLLIVVVDGGGGGVLGGHGPRVYRRRPAGQPRTSGLTRAGTSAPVAMAIALRAASSAIAARVSRVAEPRCGRSITFSSSARPGARAGSSS